MSLGTSNRDGGKTSESGHLRSVTKGFSGEILTGLAVSQRGAGANMSVDVAIGDAIIPRSDGTYGHPSFNDATLNKTITTADPSNPRRDIVIMYIDYSVTPSIGVSNNTNGVVAVAVVAGTPAGSPADPTDSALASAAGSGNPYVKLARVRVGAGVTSIGNSVIDDLRTMARPVHNGGWEPLSSAAAAWAYNAWDSTNKLATITVADSSIFTLGQKVRYWQSTGGWKYGFIVKLSDSTHIIVYQGTDYTLNNEQIYLPAFSMHKTPAGFNTDPLKWTQTLRDTSDRSQSSPTNGTWYNMGSLSLTVPIGSWLVRAKATIQVNTSACDASVSLSTANNSSTDADFDQHYYDGSCSPAHLAPYFMEKPINVTSNTPYYLVAKVSATASLLQFAGSSATTLVTARCAYL